MCPHILRYLSTAVITTSCSSTRRRVVIKDLVKVIEQESYTYKDPITEFLQCLYVDFDFDGAQKKLRECEAVGFSETKLICGQCIQVILVSNEGAFHLRFARIFSRKFFFYVLFRRNIPHCRCVNISCSLVSGAKKWFLLVWLYWWISGECPSFYFRNFL
jgi:hypothetical protein